MYKFINGINKNGPRHTNMKSHVFNTTNKQQIQQSNMLGSKTFSLFSQPYLDRFNQCYKNIIVINLQPQGPLSEFVSRVQFPPLSEFKQPGQCDPLRQCGLALRSLDGYCSMGCKKTDDLMITDEVPNLISFLVANGYTVDTSITKMFNNSDIRFDINVGNKLICFVTYNG
jgi:hypothetical protein